MKTRLVRIIALFACLASSVVFAHEPEAEQFPVLRAAYVNFPPLTYSDVNGDPAGYLITLTEQVARRAGYRLNWEELPISRIFLQLKLGEVDLWAGVGDMPHLQPLSVETTARIGELTMAAFGFKDVPETCEFKDLTGSKLILMSGYTYFGTLDFLKEDSRTQFNYAPHHRAGLGMLMRGRGDYFLDYIEPLSMVLAEHPVEGLKWCELRKSRLAILVSRQTENHQVIMDQINTAIEEGQF